MENVELEKEQPKISFLKKFIDFNIAFWERVTYLVIGLLLGATIMVVLQFI